MTQVIPLFITPLFAVSIPEGLPKLETIKNYEFKETNTPNKRDFFVTKKMSVLDDFPEERDILLNKFNEIKNNHLSLTETEFIITRSWGTKVEKGSFSEYHFHSNNYYSGVFYFSDCEDNSAPIEFENPLGGFQTFDFHVENYNAINSRFQTVNIAKNTLILFPSYVRHRIGHHLSDTPRYSLAFNFHPINRYGEGGNAINLISIK